VTALTADLLEEGLIERIAGPSGGGRRGRPREALKIRGAARLVAGAKVSHRAVSVLLADFEGTEIGSHSVPRAAPQATPEALVEEVTGAIAAACRAHGRDHRAVSGVGLGLAGHIDGASGRVHWSSALDRRAVALGPLFEACAPYPVFLENDANLVAKAEQLFGRGRGVDDFLVVTLQYGVGLGVVIDGRLYRGARGCGGEFGHTVVMQDGPLCQCGRRGCLEAFAGGYALRARAEEAGHRIGTLSDLIALEAAGHGAIAATLAEARGHFAAGLSNLITLFDPSLVILAVEAEGGHPLATPDVLARARDRAVRIDAPPPEIALHAWGDAMWDRGATAYAIERVEAFSARGLLPGQPAM
jgi:predicted NBD/HSP70 family sugar kinase